ncbi:MAG: hypothetical protein LH631_09710, partial [Alkalinema sp. CAN_BIN05]|nr:hypothetical protein [Alkalinema sp. CAN_BIN05]
APQLRIKDLPLILSPGGTFVSRAQFIRAVCQEISVLLNSHSLDYAIRGIRPLDDWESKYKNT